MESIFNALNAVIPFLCYMLYGYFFRGIGITDDAFYKKLNKFIFWGLFTVMMFNNMYNMDLSMMPKLSFILFAWGTLGALILLLVLILPRICKTKPRCSVIIQGIYRSNVLLFAVPLSESIFGSEGAALGSILVALIVPVYNVSAAILFACFDERNAKPSAADIIRKVLVNPLILGTIVGLLFLFLHIPVPKALLTPIGKFASMASPLAIFGLGGTLYFSNIAKNLKYIGFVLVMKLLVVPAVIIALTTLLPFSNVERFLLVAVYATPIAAASFPMAQNMGGDGELAAQLVAISTVASVFTLFLWIFVMSSTGLI